MKLALANERIGETVDTDKDEIYNSLREKLEDAGFKFEREQPPHFQGVRNKELKFIHPELIDAFSSEGLRVGGKKFYIKPLSDGVDSDIGFTTGKTSPLVTHEYFQAPNAIDTYRNTVPNAWVNRVGDLAFDKLLNNIKSYLMPSLEDVMVEFSDQISVSLNDTAEERKKRLEKSTKKPAK